MKKMLKKSIFMKDLLKYHFLTTYIYEEFCEKIVKKI